MIQYFRGRQPIMHDIRSRRSALDGYNSIESYRSIQDGYATNSQRKAT